MSIFSRSGKVADDLTACVFTVGEPNFETCVKSVEAQTLRPRHIEVVRDVSPLPRAYNEGLARVKTEFFVIVDADVVFHRNAFARLYRAIKKSGDVFTTLGWCADPLLGRIDAGYRMHRTAAVREIGGFPEERGHERLLITNGEEAGYRLVHVRKILAAHHPTYTPAEAHAKFREITRRIRLFAGGGEFLRHFRLLAKGFEKTGDPVYVYAMAGMMESLGESGEQLHHAQTAEQYRPSEQFERLKELLERGGPPPGGNS